MDWYLGKMYASPLRPKNGYILLRLHQLEQKKAVVFIFRDFVGEEV